jgi:hypothetical protein
MPSPTAADRLLDKLRRLATESLDDEERALFAALIAPGIAAAYGEAEVQGFDSMAVATVLPNALADAIRGREIRIEGL